MRFARYVILSIGALAAGCGPVESTSLQWQVERSLRRAEALGAARDAPYELTSAQRYLHKGKEEAGYSAFEMAIDYFHKAKAMAKRAEEKTDAARKMKAPLTESERPPPPPRAPAEKGSGK